MKTMVLPENSWSLVMATATPDVPEPEATPEVTDFFGRFVFLENMKQMFLVKRKHFFLKHTYTHIATNIPVHSHDRKPNMVGRLCLLFFNKRHCMLIDHAYCSNEFFCSALSHTKQILSR